MLPKNQLNLAFGIANAIVSICTICIAEEPGEFIYLFIYLFIIIPIVIIIIIIISIIIIINIIIIIIIIIITISIIIIGIISSSSSSSSIIIIIIIYFIPLQAHKIIYFTIFFFSSPILDSGHYHVGERSIIVSTRDVNTTNQPGIYVPVWTFEANIDQKVKFHFSRYTFALSRIEIGDGVVRGIETRLASFKEFSTPSDVTSISNLAWLSINTPLSVQYTELQISAVTTVGKP